MTPTDHGPIPRSRSSRSETVAEGTFFSRSSSTERQSRVSVAPRRACSPSARSCAGDAPPSVSQSGAACRSPTFGESFRMIAFSIARARRDSISWPASARACVGDGAHAHHPLAREVRDRPAQELVVAEAAEELGVVVVDREHPAQLLDRRLARPAQDTVPSRSCVASACSSPIAARSTPSRHTRVASDAPRAVRARE
jgi:hypothetical protein